MNLVFSKSQLLKPLGIINLAIPQRMTMQILSCFLLECEKDKIRFSATDFEIYSRYELPFNSPEVFSIAIPSKVFTDIIKELPEDKKIEINIIGTTIEIKSNGAKFTLTGGKKEDFPSMVELKGNNSVTISFNVLRDMINKTAFAMSTEETRFTLNGIYFIVKDKILSLVATDGRRLAYVEHPVNESISASGIVPAKTVNYLSKILTTEEGDVKITFTESMLGFSIGNINLTSRLIEGSFPDYEKVIPKKFQTELKVKTEVFKNVTRQAAVCVDPKIGPVVYDFQNQVSKITASSQNIGSADIGFEVEFEGVPFKIAFNPTYILDFMKNVTTEKTIIKLSGAVSPALWQPLGDNSYFYVTMPMRI